MEKRSNWEVHWQEVADYMFPRKADITIDRPRGDKRHTVIFDGTAIHSLELLASSLHGMLTSSVNRWFGLRFKETALIKMMKLESGLKAAQRLCSKYLQDLIFNKKYLKAILI